MLKLIIEALVVGLVIMAMGYPSNILSLRILPMDENHIPAMYLSLFITGVSSHFLFEVLKLNSYYCTSGYACLK